MSLDRRKFAACLITLPVAIKAALNGANAQESSEAVSPQDRFPHEREDVLGIMADDEIHQRAAEQARKELPRIEEQMDKVIKKRLELRNKIITLLCNEPVTHEDIDNPTELQQLFARGVNESLDLFIEKTPGSYARRLDQYTDEKLGESLLLLQEMDYELWDKSNEPLEKILEMYAQATDPEKQQMLKELGEVEPTRRCYAVS